MDWNRMCLHDQEVARKLAKSLGFIIDDNGGVRKVDKPQTKSDRVTIIQCDDPDPMRES